MAQGKMDKPMQKRMLAVGSSVIFALCVSACGGGGGVSSTPPPPSPVVVPPPPPPPPPPPVTTNFNTREFRQSDGPGYHNAIAAYQLGATGQGIIVGVVDTGIDPDSHEFTGRVHPQSFDATGGGRPIDDVDGHGTAVSRVIAAAKDDLDMHGIAFNATILALRGDTAGSCTTPAPGEQEANCSFSDMSIANGINRAVDVGARVINISLGGDGGISNNLRLAVQRATLAGIVIIVSAGNERNDTPPDYDPLNPSPFAQALLANGNGLVIISTSVDENDGISDFSNLAGASQASVLSALGDAVCCVYENDSLKITTNNGQDFVSLYAGTSFSAPQIAGAAALLAEAFPNLTGAQIVDLLLTSARDVGAVGTDEVFGRGILDIGRAFAPVGTTSFAGLGILVPLTGTAGTTSGAMGDAGGQSGPVGAVILDGYGRAYDIDLRHGLGVAAPELRLAPILTNRGRLVSMNAGTTELAFSIGVGAFGGASLNPLSLSGGEREGARILAGRVTASLAHDLRFSLGIRQAAAGQVAILQGWSGGAFLTATDARLESGFRRSPESALALRKQLGTVGITLSAETGQAILYEGREDIAVRDGYNRYSYNGFGLAIDRQLGPLHLAIGVNWLNERETILGARFSESFGQNGAQNLFVDAGGNARLGADWTIGANWRQGWTHADASAIIGHDSLLTSNAFSFDVTRKNLFMAHDQFAVRVSQPLRVSGGGLALNVPVAYDYSTQSATFGVRQFNLAPKGREIASEVAWTLPLPAGYLTSNLFWRQEPGHFENAPDDVGVAFRLNLNF